MANLPIDYQKLHLLKILPKNISADNNIQELSSVLDDELQKICKIVDNLNLIDKIDVLPEEIVNLLAWQWHVDYYDNTLPLQNKRRLVKESIRVHKTKGTAWAVENVVKSALGDSRIEEWYEYEGEPYHFRIICNKNTVGNISGSKVIEAINSVKNVRSHLDEVRTVISHKDEESINNYTGAIHVQRGRKTFPVGYDREKISAVTYPFFTGTAVYKNGVKDLGLSINDNLKGDLYYGQYSFMTGSKFVDMEYPDDLPPKRYNINLETDSAYYSSFGTVFTGSKFIDTEYPDVLPELQHDFDITDNHNLHNGFVYSVSGLRFIDTEYPEKLPEKHTEYHCSENSNIFNGVIYTTFGIKTINASTEEDIHSEYDIAFDDNADVYAGGANINVGTKIISHDIDEKSIRGDGYNSVVELITGVRNLGVGIDSKVDMSTAGGAVTNVSGSKSITGISEIKSETITSIGNVHNTDGFKSITIKPEPETANTLLTNSLIDSRGGSKTIGVEYDYSAKYATDTIIKTDIFTGASVSVKKNYIIKEDK